MSAVDPTIASRLTEAAQDTGSPSPATETRHLRRPVLLASVNSSSTLSLHRIWYLLGLIIVPCFITAFLLKTYHSIGRESPIDIRHTRAWLQHPEWIYDTELRGAFMPEILHEPVSLSKSLGPMSPLLMICTSPQSTKYRSYVREILVSAVLRSVNVIFVTGVSQKSDDDELAEEMETYEDMLIGNYVSRDDLQTDHLCRALSIKYAAHSKIADSQVLISTAMTSTVNYAELMQLLLDLQLIPWHLAPREEWLTHLKPLRVRDSVMQGRGIIASWRINTDGRLAATSTSFILPIEAASQLKEKLEDMHRRCWTGTLFPPIHLNLRANSIFPSTLSVTSTNLAKRECPYEETELSMILGHIVETTDINIYNSTHFYPDESACTDGVCQCDDWLFYDKGNPQLSPAGVLDELLQQCPNISESNFEKEVEGIEGTLMVSPSVPDIEFDQNYCMSTSRAVFGVLTHIDDLELRDAMRRRFAKAGLAKHLIFPVGRRRGAYGQALMSKLMEEQRSNGDLIQGNYHDTYYTLSGKAMTLIKWAHECRNLNPTLTWIAKTDVDVLINARLVDQCLKRISEDGMVRVGQEIFPVENPLWIGFTWQGFHLIKDPKNRNYEALNTDEFPPYQSGGLYMMNVATAELILERRLSTEFKDLHFRNEDAMMGILLYDTTVTPLKLPQSYGLGILAKNAYCDSADTCAARIMKNCSSVLAVYESTYVTNETINAMTQCHIGVTEAQIELEAVDKPSGLLSHPLQNEDPLRPIWWALTGLIGFYQSFSF